MNPTTELKRLNTLLSELRDERHALDGRLRAIDKKIAAMLAQIAKLQTQTKGLIVSEHAILRYLERIKKVDIGAIKQEILGGVDPHKCAPIDGTFPVGEHIVRIKNSVIITVIERTK